MQAVDGSREPLDASRGCERPVVVEMVGRPDQLLVGLGKERHTPVMAEISVPCRKCPACLRNRGRRWAARGAAECLGSVRTWFGTLTVRPALQMKWLATARRNCRVSGFGDFEALEPSEQFRLLNKEAGPELTRYIKRVRKQSGVPLRYLAVVEQHKSGLPHWHMLLHEVGPPTRKAILDGCWEAGFSQWRLVEQGDVKAAFYAAKYLAKSADSRVRASAGYGRGESPRRSRQKGAPAIAGDNMVSTVESMEDNSMSLDDWKKIEHMVSVSDD